MAAGQQWLFAPDKPLVQRLGQQFFRKAPAQPGVYLMRDAAGEVVYVGKAKNLRQRLRSYRVANPDRMPRRHLRMLREVTQIDLELCCSEASALAREAKLLRQLRLKFNRAGVWPAKAQFLTWRWAEEDAQFAVQEVPSVGWERMGPLGSCAPYLLGSVVRLVWVALNPRAGFAGLPNGWAHGRFLLPVTIPCGQRAPELRRALGQLFWGESGEFTAWLRACTGHSLSGFEESAILAELEEVASMAASHRDDRAAGGHQIPLL